MRACFVGLMTSNANEKCNAFRVCLYGIIHYILYEEDL